MNTSFHSAGHARASMTLLGLEPLPCGCVAGIYQTGPAVLEVEWLEAKGPHCVFSHHRAGEVTRLGVPHLVLAQADALL